MSHPFDSRFMLLKEAANFLRCSRSLLYKRKDIPRHRRPGSRILLFDREELLAWAKSSTDIDRLSQLSSSSNVPAVHKKVPHRNPRYREVQIENKTTSN